MNYKAYPRHAVNFSWNIFLELLRTPKPEFPPDYWLSAFEQAFADFMGGGEALAVASSRTGLYFLLKALGVKPGDEVILPAYTFWALPLAVAMLEAKAVMVDADPHTWNLNPAELAQALTPRTKAIIVTHIFGEPCDLAPIMEISRAHGVPVIEDCAHAVGSLYRGKPAGSFGNAALFSFNLGKNLPCFGGGMILCHQSGLKEKLLDLSLRSSLPPPEVKLPRLLYQAVTFGLFHPRIFPFGMYPLLRLLDACNSTILEDKLQDKISFSLPDAAALQLSALQARVGLKQLERLTAVNKKLSDNAMRYNQLLAAIPGITMQKSLPDTKAVKVYYLIRTPNRDTLRRKLLRQGIDTQTDYLTDCSRLPGFEAAGNFPVAARLPGLGLELPNNTWLKAQDIDYISNCLSQPAHPDSA